MHTHEQFTHTHTHSLICALQYKYSATVQSLWLWLPGSCHWLLVRLSHQRRSSFVLPADNTVILAGLIFQWQGFSGYYCAPPAIHSLVGVTFSTDKPRRWICCTVTKENHKGSNSGYISFSYTSALIIYSCYWQKIGHDLVFPVSYITYSQMSLKLVKNFLINQMNLFKLSCYFRLNSSRDPLLPCHFCMKWGVRKEQDHPRESFGTMLPFHSISKQYSSSPKLEAERKYLQWWKRCLAPLVKRQTVNILT